MMDKNKHGLVKGWAILVEMPAVATAPAVTWEEGGGQRWYYGDIPAPWAALDIHYDKTHTLTSKRQLYQIGNVAP